MLVDGSVFRGTGIRVLGAPCCDGSPPQSNITLRDFELNGQSGYTGNFGWPANPETGDGWDTSHKGISLGSNRRTEDVTIKDVAVRSFKGEMVYYAGADWLKNVLVDNIISEDTNASTMNISGENITIRNSEFGLSRFWVEVGMKHKDKDMYFHDNYFHDARLTRAFAFSAGDENDAIITVEDNVFEDCNFGEFPSEQLFQFTGSTSGNILIQNNQMINCGGIITTATPAADDSRNYDITFTNNDISTNGGAVFYFFTGTEDITVSNNTIVQADGASIPTSVLFGGQSKINTVVENNIFDFDGGRTPERAFDMADDQAFQPLFRNNIYINTTTRGNQGRGSIYISSAPKRPLFEQTVIEIREDNANFALTTTNHPDDQPTTIIFDRNFSTFLPANHATYQLNSDKTVTGGDTLDLEFDASLGKWVEVP